MQDPKQQKTLLNMLLSAGNPEIRKLAEKLAATVPQGSLLRQPIAERFLGIVNALLEARSETMGPNAGAVVEKLTDLVDFAGPALFGEEQKRGETLDNWTDQFLKDGMERISRAKPEDQQAELERLMQEFNLRKQLVEHVKGEPKSLSEKIDLLIFGTPEKAAEAAARAKAFRERMDRELKEGRQKRPWRLFG